jgi:hypothetical protein
MSSEIRIIVAPPKTTWHVIVIDETGRQHDLKLSSQEYYDLLGYFPEEC